VALIITSIAILQIAIGKTQTVGASLSTGVTYMDPSLSAHDIGSGQSATGSLGRPPAEPFQAMPLAADSLADSVGLNTHVRSNFAAADWPVLIHQVAELGVRHIRDGIVYPNVRFTAAMRELLSTSHAKLDGITDCPGIEYSKTTPTSPQKIRDFNAAIGNRLEYVESPNEVDGRADQNWAADTIACLPELRRALPEIPFIAPSLNRQADATLLGDISSQIDFGNIHRYFSGHNPGSAGWGGTSACGKYGSLLRAICDARVNSGAKPIFVTETGYNSVEEVDEATQAKYLSRAVLVNFQSGIPRTFLYELRDDLGSGGFGHDGLLRSDDTIKPAYNAIASEISYFTDDGPTSKLRPLAFSIDCPGISEILFEKHNDKYIIALWKETTSWDSVAMRRIFVAPTKVTITLPGRPVAVGDELINDDGRLESTLVQTSSRSIAVQVDDHVSLISFSLD
jgi:hypothetical protein